MRIAFLLPDLRGGGAERLSISLAHEFRRAGHEVEFVVMIRHGELLDEVRPVFPVVDLATRRVRSLPVVLARYLRKRAPDVLLAAMWPLTAVAPLAQRFARSNAKVVVSEHNTLSMQYRDRGWLHALGMRLSMSMGYRLAFARVGVSAGVVDDIATLAGMRSCSFEVIHNPVPASPCMHEVAVHEVDQSWSAPRGARVLTVGSMKAQKNHALLLRAFAQMGRRDARLMFVGDGDGREASEVLAQDLGVADRVIFAGFQTNPVPYYRTADLFVLSSDYEGFGNVIVEAMASGTPIVSTDCPSGPAEILANGKYGRLVPVGDVAALAKAIEEVLLDPPDPAILRARATEFRPDIAARKYLDLFERRG